MGRTVLMAALVLAVVAAGSAAIAAPKKQRVRVETQPAGASVFVNDVELGEVCKTNCWVEVENDSTLIIALEGHKPEIIQFSIGRKERPPYKRTVQLVEAVGKIIVEGPRGAVVEIDDKNRGKAPLEVEVLAGTHSVVLTLDDKQIYADAVEVVANDEVKVKGKASTASKDPPDTDPDPDPDPDPDDPDAKITKPAKPVSRAGRVFSVSAAVSVGFRNFTYNDVQMDAENLNPSNEKGQIVAGPVVEVWPGVALGVKALRGLSLIGRAQLGLNPQEVLDDVTGLPIGAKTFWRTFEGSLRQRFTFADTFSVEGAVGYLYDIHRFEGDATQVPDAEYQSLRLAIKMSATFGKYEPYLGYDNLIVMSGTGQLVNNFPAGSTTVSGLKVSGGIAANFGHISARLEASHTRYSWVFRMGDASSALDAISYVSLIAGYAY